MQQSRQAGNLHHLRALGLFDNQLTGPLSPELGQLTQLMYLDVGGNRLRGTLPPELGQLAHLRMLDLSDNRLTGPLPSELGQLTCMVLVLLFADFQGFIPYAPASPGGAHHFVMFGPATRMHAPVDHSHCTVHALF